MGRYKDPSCKICRRNRVKLYLKGERCETAKCAIEKRNFPPGPRVGFGRKMTEFGRRLREKQKLRFYYGVSEKQMRIYFARASRQKGITGHNLIGIFERRIDNVVYRSCLAGSRQDARQLVNHGHIRVNGKDVDIASYLVNEGDEIQLKHPDKESNKKRIETLKSKEMPAWMSFDDGKKAITFLNMPQRSELDVPVEEQLIVEFYSK